MVIYMFKEGDFVSRYSYDNDIVFIITKIENNNYILKYSYKELMTSDTSGAIRD